MKIQDNSIIMTDAEQLIYEYDPICRKRGYAIETIDDNSIKLVRADKNERDVFPEYILTLKWEDDELGYEQIQTIFPKVTEVNEDIYKKIRLWSEMAEALEDMYDTAYYKKAYEYDKEWVEWITMNLDFKVA